MRTADHIIDALGGTSKVAKALNLTPSTVSSWRAAEYIPDWRQPAVIALAKKAKQPISSADFPPRPVRGLPAPSTPKQGQAA